MMTRVPVRALFFLTTIMMLVACSTGGGTAGESAGDLLPGMNDYNTLDYDSILDGLTALNVSLLVGSQGTAAPGVAQIAAVDAILECTQKSGAVDFELYSHVDVPASAGAAVIVNETRLLDLSTILNCAQPVFETNNAGFEFNPCYDAWTVEEDDATYRMLYAGTTTEVCVDMCSEMPGCTMP